MATSVKHILVTTTDRKHLLRHALSTADFVTVNVFCQLQAWTMDTR